MNTMTQRQNILMAGNIYVLNLNSDFKMKVFIVYTRTGNDRPDIVPHKEFEHHL